MTAETPVLSLIAFDQSPLVKMKTPSLKALLLSPLLLAVLLTSTAQAKSDALASRTAQIDQLVADKLAAEKLHPNAQASDEVFVRRVYLDVVGRIPSAKETLVFLESK